MTFTPGPRIYNLFPRLVGGMEGWKNHFERIKAMGFDWVYVNPFHFAGYSGSLYAVKDYYAFHPMFVDDRRPISHQAQLQEVIDAAHAHGLKFMMDLVINHTAFDSVIATEHPEWYQQNEDGSLKRPGCWEGETWVEWGDLATLDNANSRDRDGLWRYWLKMMRHYLDMGVDGFRCDAAYHVPLELWNFLIPAVRNAYPQTAFFAETLGCRPCELIEVAEVGFDYVFNSVRWWNFREPWFLDVHTRTLGAAPSIGFPESHDTERVASEFAGNVIGARQKYMFTALFSAGVLMPIGYEYGFKQRLDVVTTTPDHWEASTYDLSDFIGAVHALKASARVFNEDGPLIAIPTDNENVKAYAKGTLDAREKALFVLNLDFEQPQTFKILTVADLVGTRHLQDVSLEHRWETVGETLEGQLAPGACQVFLGSLASPDATPHGKDGRMSAAHPTVQA